MTSLDDGFEELMARVRAGDDMAETVVFRRYVRRLIALAARQFDAWMRDQADVENVVLSAYKSFFLRNRRDEYDLADWDALWSLLVIITLHKCTRRRNHLHAARRDVRRQIHSGGTGHRANVARRPGPHSDRGGDPHRDCGALASRNGTRRSRDRRADPRGLHRP